MKRLFLSIITATLFLVSPSLTVASDYNSGSKTVPSVGQQVVREGDYAIELVQTLKIGPQEKETDAETALANIGIAPKSGWISNFPVTPDIIAQLQTAIAAAANAGKLPMNKADAEQAFAALNSKIGIEVAQAGTGEQYTGDEAYTAPTVVENYYYDEGPPIITYYAPPPDFAYLYLWDPFPFWCGGFWFPGYYVLSDFDFTFAGYNGFTFTNRDDFRFYRHHRWMLRGDRQISSHIIDPVTGHAVALDPVSKRPFVRTDFRPIGARSFAPVSRVALRGQRIIGNTGFNGERRFGRFNSRSAQRILDRSVSRPGTPGAPIFGRKLRPSQGFRSGSAPARSFRSLGRPGVSGRIPWRRPENITGRFNAPNIRRSFNRPAINGNRAFGTFRQGRSFGAPARSFNNAPVRSFSAPARSFGASSAFRGGGSIGRGHSFGGGHGFSGGGHSFGGGRGFGGGGHSFGGHGGGRSGR